MSKFFIIIGTKACINTDELLLFNASTTKAADGTSKHCIEYMLKHDLRESTGASVSALRRAFFENEEDLYCEWKRLTEFVGASK